MICKKCGAILEEGSRFCRMCGEPLYPAQSQTPGRTGDQQTAAYGQSQAAWHTGGRQTGAYGQGWQQPGYRQPMWQQGYSGYWDANRPFGNTAPPMKWFKFLINFSLWAGAITNMLLGLMYLTGAYYAFYLGVRSNVIYRMFPGLRAADMLYGLILGCAGGFMLYTRFQLAGFKRVGPMCLYICYGVHGISSLVYILLVALMAGSGGLNAYSGPSVIASGVTGLVVSLLFIIFNFVYFKKREQLFVNR